jgi:heme-degrading monooxygenase HmoA
MFARNAHFQLKSLNLAAEFAWRFENEMLPLLRQQKGFKGEITLSNPGSLEQIAISLWESKENAEAYNANIYPKVLKILAKVIDGRPKIRTFDSVTLNLELGKQRGKA